MTDTFLLSTVPQKLFNKQLPVQTKKYRRADFHLNKVAIEKFTPEPNQQLFDMAIAVRVGALDGRHPEIEKQSLKNIARLLTKEGKLFIDGGNPLKEIQLDEYRNNE